MGGAVAFTLGPCCSLLGRVPGRGGRCAFAGGGRGEVMMFFGGNGVLGVGPGRVLSVLEGI